MKTNKEDLLRDLSKKAVEKVNDMYPDEPPMKWPESPKKPDLKVVSAK